MTLVTTPGGSTSNSYISLANAVTFFGTRPNGNDFLTTNGSTARTDAGREALLIEATAQIDAVCEARGGVRPALSNGYYAQALMYPWLQKHWYTSPNDPHFLATSASAAGSTTTIIASALEYFPSSRIVGAWAFVNETTDYAAPRHEVREITGWTASTYTISVSTLVSAVETNAFTAAVDNGDTITIVFAIPEWLKRATCLQALHLCDQRRGVAQGANHGMSSVSDDSGSVSFSEPGPWAGIDYEVKRILLAHLPGIRIG